MRRYFRLRFIAPALAIVICAIAIWSVLPRGSAPAPQTTRETLLSASRTSAAASDDVTPVSYTSLLGSIRDGNVQDAVVNQASGIVAVSANKKTLTSPYPVDDVSSLVGALSTHGVDAFLTTPTGGMSGAIARGTGEGGGGFNFMMFATIFLGAAVIFIAVRQIFRMRNLGKTPEIAVVASNDGEIPVITFADVAGQDEAVEDMEELVAYLNDPERFAEVGARAPHGALLCGPAGTGKTLLAKALAGESGCSFFAVSGSDFVEMYVGVGAKRVRELFQKARACPNGAIIFIDEIDAVGRARSGADARSVNTEQEATLNALLVEMDGFTSRDKIVVIGATNRDDVLDAALLRPGRLERRINVRLPNRIGREAILRVHAEGKPLDETADLDLIAKRTSGFSGAELAALLNEAALILVRQGRDRITDRDLSHATETIAMGRVRTSAIITPEDRNITAWHEAGHAVCSLVQNPGSVASVSLLPRGNSGGQTWFEQEDISFLTRKSAYARLVTGLGGMAAEELYFGDGEFSTGPSGDLQSVSQTALSMVAQYGMADALLVKDSSLLSTGGDVTKDVADAAEALLQRARLDAKQLLSDNRALFDHFVEALLEWDTLTKEQIESIMAGHPALAPTPPPAPRLHKPTLSTPPRIVVPRSTPVVSGPRGGISAALVAMVLSGGFRRKKRHGAI